MSWWARSVRASTKRVGLMPVALGTAKPAAMRRFRPATRTMKNSSRLDAKIARKRARSSNGVPSSSASSSTRSLNASHESSRSKKRSSGRGDVSDASGATGGSAKVSSDAASAAMVAALSSAADFLARALGAALAGLSVLGPGTAGSTVSDIGTWCHGARRVATLVVPSRDRERDLHTLRAVIAHRAVERVVARPKLHGEGVGLARADDPGRPARRTLEDQVVAHGAV